ncbi:KipI antagonist [Anaerobacillus alkalilacustris]|uniref:KipI antagonist n=1 Tax=Anaerobacillus alkalilacustris TaxID=393763 RepID=A0A1S2LP06_9BACI|nr:biotin-dependent carboxyltransferase family protein [Anaerobacillus alkalilacustris]OIJ14211.1 KipI antagonist [Anaerobacillus alkalilacustris]
MSIVILRPGLLTTIQDLGRFGYQKYGVIVSGAMDPYALRIANLLVGNDEGAASLEITVTGPFLKFEQDCLIAITGGDLSPSIENVLVPLWKPVLVRKGTVLQFGACNKGCRAYLAVAGGFSVDEVMGSCSTYLRANLGGFQGRALQKGDIVSLKVPTEQNKAIEQICSLTEPYFSTTSWNVNTEWIRQDIEINTIRVIAGTHFDLFTEECRNSFYHNTFTITPQSDRMGYRLSGPDLQLINPFEMLSEAVTLGTIQVPADGNPIILLADRQTTGGYPRIGQVVSVDNPTLAQLKPGEKIRFKKVSIEEAEALYISRENELNELKTGLNLKLNKK